MEERPRCPWCSGHDLLRAYHDVEWGVPLHDDRGLLEKLILDGAQAGLSWLMILKRRDGYLRAFEGFDPERLAAYGEDEVARLLADPGIIRNRQKVLSAIGNARAWLSLQEREGSFADWLWGFVDGRPVDNRWRRVGEVPTETDLSRTISRELRGRGFSFVGPTIVYAFLQAVGIVNDHLVDCFRHGEVRALAGTPA